MNAKIADLELGTADKSGEDAEGVKGKRDDVDRALFRCLKTVLYGSSKRSAMDTAEDGLDERESSIIVDGNAPPKKSFSMAMGEQRERKKRGKMKAEDFLANWSAPEVITSAQHSQASDVYAFALVLWEILTGTVPFSNVKKQDDIRLKVPCYRVA